MQRLAETLADNWLKQYVVRMRSHSGYDREGDLLDKDVESLVQLQWYGTTAFHSPQNLGWEVELHGRGGNESPLARMEPTVRQCCSVLKCLPGQLEARGPMWKANRPPTFCPFDLLPAMINGQLYSIGQLAQIAVYPSPSSSSHRPGCSSHGKQGSSVANKTFGGHIECILKRILSGEFNFLNSPGPVSYSPV